MTSQQIWIKETKKGKLNSLRALKGFFIREEDFVHSQKGDYRLHVRYPARGVDNHNCRLELYHNGKCIRYLYPVPIASLESAKLSVAMNGVR